MKTKRSRSSTNTRAKLIEAAGPVFARVGFHSATVQEICATAGANIAAVNYHFGDKLGLYREVLRSSRASPTSQPGHGGPDLPPEERLRGFVHAFLTHLFGEGRPSWFARVIAHEMADPTPALGDLIELDARPGFERLKRIVSEISGQPEDDDRLNLGAYSVIGQCLVYFHSRAVIAELWPELKMKGERIDQIAEHITRFSLAGLASIGDRTAKVKRPRGGRAASLAKKRKGKQ